MVLSSLFEVEHAYYVGNYLSGILYGIILVMYIMTMRSLIGQRNSNSNKGQRVFNGVYSTISILLSTIDISCNVIWGEQMWITFRDGPAGVPGFVFSDTSLWYQIFGSASVIALTFMGDALLLYRLFIIYGSNYLVLLIPSFAYLAAFPFAIIDLVLAGKPGGNFFGGKAINFGTPYFAITISLNIIVTLLICLRLFKLKKRLSYALGNESARMYTSVASMLVESAAPYSLVGIMFLVSYALSSRVATPFGQVWGRLACISPQLIILRVVTGKAWAKEVVTQAQSDLVFGAKQSHIHTSGVEMSPGVCFSSNDVVVGGAPSEKRDANKQSAENLQNSVV